jgi:hypothetical protein
LRLRVGASGAESIDEMEYVYKTNQNALMGIQHFLLVYILPVAIFEIIPENQ